MVFFVPEYDEGLKKADQYLEEKCPEKAVKMLEKLLKHYKARFQQDHLFAKLGDIYGEVGQLKDFHRAIFWYAKVSIYYDNYKYIQYVLGKLYWLTKNYEKAISYYEIAEKAGIPEAANNLGYCYEVGDGVAVNHQKAIKLYQKAYHQGLEISGNNLVNICKKSIDTVFKAADLLKEKGSSNDELFQVFEWISTEDLIQLRERQKEIDKYSFYDWLCIQELVHRDEKTYYRTLALYYREKGDDEKAYTWFKRSAEETNDSRSWYRLSFYGSKDEKIRCLENAVATKRVKSNGYRNSLVRLGVMMRKNGQYLRAKELLEQAVELDVKNAHKQMAFLYCDKKYPQSSFKKAIEYAEKCNYSDFKDEDIELLYRIACKENENEIAYSLCQKLTPETNKNVALWMGLHLVSGTGVSKNRQSGLNYLNHALMNDGQMAAAEVLIDNCLHPTTDECIELFKASEIIKRFDVPHRQEWIKELKRVVLYDWNIFTSEEIAEATELFLDENSVLYDLEMALLCQCKETHLSISDLLDHEPLPYSAEIEEVFLDGYRMESQGFDYQKAKKKYQKAAEGGHLLAIHRIIEHTKDTQERAYWLNKYPLQNKVLTKTDVMALALRGWRLAYEILATWHPINQQMQKILYRWFTERAQAGDPEAMVWLYHDSVLCPAEEKVQWMKNAIYLAHGKALYLGAYFLGFDESSRFSMFRYSKESNYLDWMTGDEDYVEPPSLEMIEKIDTFEIKLYRERKGGYRANTKPGWLKEIQPWSKEKWLNSEVFRLEKMNILSKMIGL